jgi:hypothetical protein
MMTAQKVLARYLEAAMPKAAYFDVEAFAKFHPVYNVMKKERPIGDKAMAQANRFMEFASKAESYKGDASRIQPNLDKAFVATEALVACAGRVLKAADPFISEYGQDMSSDYRKRILGDLVRWYRKLEDSVGKVTSADPYKERFVGRSYGISRDVSTLHLNFANLTSAVEMASKIQMERPGQTAPDASEEDRFKAFMTRDIIAMAKASAKKLENKPALCAALGLDVMEDVNAHSAQSKVQSMLDHYVKDIPEADYDKVRGLVGKVSSAIDWGIVEAGAFLVAILQVSRAPEAGRVSDTLAKAFAEFTKD